MNWEDIDYNHKRAKVFGGWLVKTFEEVTHNLPEQGLVGGWDWRVAMSFVPDTNHEWQLEPPETEERGQ
jgi:hypothetical protein